MDDFEKIMKTLQTDAIEAAKRLDPAFAESVAEERKVIADHESRLEAQPSQQKMPPIEQRKPAAESFRAQLLAVVETFSETEARLVLEFVRTQLQATAKPEPSQSEKEILELVNKAAIERRGL